MAKRAYGATRVNHVNLEQLQTGVLFLFTQQVQPAFMQAVMHSQQAWIISQHLASPLVQVMQAPSSVISHLHLPMSEDTGPHPADRSKSGSRHHVMTAAQGIPLAATVTAANVNEVTHAL